MWIGSIQDIIDNMKNGVYDFIKNGECSGCGQCCSDMLPVSVKECKRIRDYIQRKHIRECVNRPPTSEPVRDFTCPFRDNERRICTIYEVRPAICRDFRCDKPRKDIWANKEMFHERYGVVNMREMFFPKE